MKAILRGSLLESLPARSDAERFEELVRHPAARIERIVSTGQTTPPGRWYDQDWDEWVMVVQGSAVLTIEEESLEMKAGDWVFLPAHCRHRVERTEPEGTIWLAIHLPAAASANSGSGS